MKVRISRHHFIQLFESYSNGQVAISLLLYSPSQLIMSRPDEYLWEFHTLAAPPLTITTSPHRKIISLPSSIFSISSASLLSNPSQHITSHHHILTLLITTHSFIQICLSLHRSYSDEYPPLASRRKSKESKSRITMR